MMVGTLTDSRPLVVPALGAGAGIILGVLAPGEPLFWLIGVFISLICVLLFKKAGRNAIPGFTLLALFVFALNASIAANPTLPSEGIYAVQGVVNEEAKVDGEGHSTVYLRDLKITDAQNETSYVAGAYWTAYELFADQTQAPLPGEIIRFTAKLYYPKGQTNPSGFDFRLYLLRKGATVGLYGKDDYVDTGIRQTDFHSVSYSIRSALSSRLDTLFKDNSALPKALLLGESESLPDETREAFARSGVAHVLAISGLHVGLLAGALAIFLKRFLFPGARAVVISLFLLLYCFLLDFSPTVVRASILMAAVLFNLSRGRRADTMSVLALSFMVILAIHPLDLFSSGFQLSFCAVLGILLLRNWLSKALVFIKYMRIRSAFVTTISALLGTLIPASLIFHRFSVIGIIISPLVCALLSLLMPCYVLTLIIGSLIPPLGLALGSIFGAATEWLQNGIVFLGNLSFSSVHIPDIPWPLIPALAALLIFLSPYTVLSVKKKAIIFSALFLFGCAGHLLTVDNGQSYTLFDTGSADCAVVQDGRSTAVIDTGDNSSDLCSYLLSKGRKIDMLFLTHLHSDHCLGVNDLIDEGILIGQVIFPLDAEKSDVSAECLAVVDRLKEYGVPILYASKGDVFHVGGISLTVVWPEEGTVLPGRDANIYSMAILCEMNGTRLYLSSDITGDYDHYAGQKADVLKVAHHGGKNDTSLQFLDEVRPSVALISASYQSNISDTLARLRESGAAAFITGMCGAIRIEPSATGVVVKPFTKSEAIQ